MGLTLAAASLAFASLPWIDPPPRAKVELLAETSALVPGQANALALHFTIDKDWHLYYAGQNDTGFPPTIESATLPDGFTLGALQWPVPVRHVADGNLLDHIYEREVTLLLPLNVPATAQGSATISFSLKWLVCKDVCLMGGQTVSLTLPVAPEAKPAEASRPIFARAREELPRPASETAAHVQTKWLNGALVLSPIVIAPPGNDRPAPTPARLEFYPSIDSATIRDLIGTGQSETGEMTLDVGDGAAAVRGMFAVFPRPKDNKPIVYWIECPVPVRGNLDPARPSDQQPHSGR